VLASPRRFGIALVLVSLIVLLAFSATGLSGLGRAVQSDVAGPYTVTFNETGLPGGSYWAVHISQVGCSCTTYSKTIKTNSTSIVFDLANGTYAYNIQRVAGFYVVGPAHGTIVVNGTNVAPVNVPFRLVITYLTEFTETGLPNGTLWTVTVHGNGTGQLAALEDLVGHSYGTALNFTLPNGSYHYVVAPVNGSFFLNHSSRGTFVINGSGPAPISVAWLSPPVYAITFHESGLPSGMNWSVRVAGWGGVAIHETVSSNSSNVTFYLPNGTFHFVVGLVIFFNVPTPGSGTFGVTNVSQTFNVSFTPVSPGAFYPVAFTESGLANGSHWWVRIVLTNTFGHSRSTSASSNGTSVFFLLQNGSYRFQVHGPRTYTIASGGSGTFSILGSSPSAFPVTFRPIPTYSVTFAQSGLPNGTVWSVLVRTGSAGSTPWPIRLTEASNSTSLSFSLPNGTYCYRFNAVPGYTFSSGTVTAPFTVAGGGPATITVGFSPKA
jgi:hypothetical protein